MTLPELTQLITAISSVATPTLAVVGYLELHRNNERLTTKIDDVHDLTNHMKDELVREVRQSSHAEGVKDEKERTQPGS